MIELHWTRDEVLDQVDIAFLEDLFRAWADWPPLRKFAAAYLGHKPKAKPTSRARPAANLAELQSLIG